MLLNLSFRLLHGSPASPKSILQVTRRCQITLSKQKALKRHLHASTVSEATSQPRSTPMPNEAPENCYLKKMGLTQSTFTYTLTNYIYLITTTWKRSNKTEREINANWALCITCAVLCLFTLEAPIKTGCHFFFFFSKEMQDHANRWWKAVQTLCCLLYLVILNRLQTDNCNVPICFWRLESWTATPLGSFLLLYFLLLFLVLMFGLVALAPKCTGIDAL